MKAAILEAAGQPLQIRDDLEIAPPGPGRVRVDISHCGVCHSDLSMVDGAFPAALEGPTSGHNVTGTGQWLIHCRIILYKKLANGLEPLTCCLQGTRGTPLFRLG